MYSKPYSILFYTVPIFIIITILITGCSGAKEVASNWNNNQVSIDGNAMEWGKNLQYIKDENIAVGFENDDKFLYLCLTSADRSRIMPILGGGLIIWFKPENGGKTFGVKYPMPLDRGEFQNPSQREFGLDNGDFNRDDRSELMNRMLDRQNELQIVDEDKHPLNLYPISSTHGIKAKLGYHSDQFVYELEVPLSTDNKYPYELSVGKDNKIKIEFETQEMERKNFKRPRNEDENSGNMDGGDGEGMGAGDEGGQMGGGRRHFNGEEGGQKSFEPIDLSFEVTLKNTH